MSGYLGNQCGIQNVLRFLLLTLALTLAACAGPRMERGTPVPETVSGPAWDAYETYANGRDAEQGSYRLNASLRYGTEGDTRRVVILVWSNGELPIRLDVMAGVGPLVARIREAADGLIVYAPGENKALVHKGSQRVVLNFGKPVPFTLRDFSALMRGKFHEVFGPAQGLNPAYTPVGNVEYVLSGGDLAGMLELTPEGLPVRWRESGEQGWSMELGYDDATPPLPYKIKLERPDGYSAILLVKNRQTPESAFTEKQLALDLPAGVDIEAVRKK